jgi:hypothetical protein
MAYSGGIDFISDVTQDLVVPSPEDLGFTGCGKALHVKVRRFGENCRVEQKEKGHVVVNGTEEVGCIWFDVADRIEFKHCVVVGMDRNDKKENAGKTYYVLIIRERPEDYRNILGRLTVLFRRKLGQGRYERLGIGKVEAQYVSRDCNAGTLW